MKHLPERQFYFNKKIKIQRGAFDRYKLKVDALLKLYKNALYKDVYKRQVRCMANHEMQTLLFSAESKTDIINMIKFYEIQQFNKEQR